LRATWIDDQLLEADAGRVDLEFFDGHDLLVPLMTDVDAESF